MFLRLIKMIIAPLVFSTLVAGIAHMGDIAALGRVGIRSLGWFILATFVSLTLGLILVTALHPGVGLNLPIPPSNAASGVETAAFNLKDFVSHVVPAIDLRGDEQQRNPADRRLLHLLRSRAHRRRGDRESRWSAASNRWSG